MDYWLTKFPIYFSKWLQGFILGKYLWEGVGDFCFSKKYLWYNIDAKYCKIITCEFQRHFFTAFYKIKSLCSTEKALAQKS